MKTDEIASANLFHFFPVYGRITVELKVYQISLNLNKFSGIFLRDVWNAERRTLCLQLWVYFSAGASSEGGSRRSLNDHRGSNDQNLTTLDIFFCNPLYMLTFSYLNNPLVSTGFFVVLWWDAKPWHRVQTGSMPWSFGGGTKSNL